MDICLKVVLVHRKNLVVTVTMAYHNQCLCPKKFTLESTSSLIVANSASDPTQSNTTSDLPTTNGNSNATNITQSLLALGERVLLQTAVVPLQTPDW